MPKTITLHESQLGLVKADVDYVVTGVEANAFTIAKGADVITVEGKLTGAKIGTLVQVRNGVLAASSKQAAPAAGERKHNPSASTLKALGL